MTLGSPDAEGIGRYTEATPITTFSAYLNLALATVSAAIGLDRKKRTRRAVLARTTALATSGAGGEVLVPFTTQALIDGPFTHSLSVNPTRLNITEAGIYKLAAFVAWASNSSGTRRVGYKVNGGTRTDLDWSSPPSTGTYPQSGVAPYVPLNGGDYLELVVVQTSGATLNITADLTLERMNPLA